jgi:50S ribosome-binding GTPase
LSEPATIALVLVSHTNAGKTTLARTLLQRDVGEVRDAPHVTEFAEDHLLWRSDAGDALRLWDTPGLGDSVRLVRRLRQQGNPVGWFLSEVWDRWRDRAFWASQQALRHVREHGDVVLYLVNAAESPQAAGYVAPEMELLAWTGKPVVVLLNQLGAPGVAAQEAADIEAWRRHLPAQARVAELLPMDAFARCWVQESTLLRAVESVLEGDRRAAMVRLRAAWARARLATFEQSMAAIARSVARLADARQPLASSSGVGDAVKRLAGVLRPLLGATARPGDPALPAQSALAAALDDEVRAGTAELIALHGLEGRSQGEILSRVAAQFERRERVHEGRAALFGGMLSGALAGLKADIASGGLTLGGGLIAGGLLGALGGAGLARGINVMRGGGTPWVGWSADAMGPIVESALLRYLAVAHFGRGRGEWAEGEAPAHWHAVVAAALAPRQAALQALWASRGARFDAPDDSARLAAALQPLLDAAARDALRALYPADWAALEASQVETGVDALG